MLANEIERRKVELVGDLRNQASSMCSLSVVDEICIMHTPRGCSCERATNEGGNTGASALRPLMKG